jgi:hypothetical protein
MRFFDALLTRRREERRFSTLPPRVHRRLAFACRELTEAEEAIAERLGLTAPPRLLIVDEETAVIITPRDRSETA